MRLKKIFYYFLSVLVLFSACRTSPKLYSYFVSENVIQHFVSPTEWTAKNSKAKLDITYRTGTDTPAVVNISFFGNKTIPERVNSVFLRTAENDCPFEYLNTILKNPDKNELRVSFSADRDGLVNLLKAKTITLYAEVDGIEHEYTPDKDFYSLKEKFLAAIQ